MSIGHRIYIFFLVFIILATLILLAFFGFPYYTLPLEERFFFEGHTALKPGGVLGHGLGILGTLFILIGITGYILRKRVRAMSGWGLLKYWLEIHIFLCTLGPVLILFHTAFKFGGLVAISFWSMVAVFFSGIVGRFIYLQIPRSIEGRELSLQEVKDMKVNIGEVLKESYPLDEESLTLLVDSTKQKIHLYSRNPFSKVFRDFIAERNTLRQINDVIIKNRLSRKERKQILHLVRHEINLNSRIERLVYMQNLFRYWHVAHFPFAIMMLVIMVIHVVVTIVLGYRWIF